MPCHEVLKAPVHAFRASGQFGLDVQRHDSFNLVHESDQLVHGNVFEPPHLEGDLL